jgi:hypothetical protein
MPKRLPRDAAATTVPAGTLGYLDPAYVMLEIMSGHRRPALARRRTTRSLRRSAERGEVDNAEKLVAVMRECDMAQYLVTFNSLVNGLNKARRMVDAWNGEGGWEGLTPYGVSYNT